MRSAALFSSLDINEAHYLKLSFVHDKDQQSNNSPHLLIIGPKGYP